MSWKHLKTKRVLQDAVRAIWIEPLEERRMLSTNCVPPIGGNGWLQICGDSAGNIIAMSYNNATAKLTVTDSVSGATAACANIDVIPVTAMEVYGGSSTSATSTGNDTIDASASPLGATIFGQDG